VKVLLGGELADEVNASYKYVGLAPSIEAAMKENVKLLSEVHYYDVLRADRTIAASSIESRVPFSDKDFVEYMLKLDINLKMPKYTNTDCMEKEYLRKAFDGYIPDELLWRKKVPYSDGVGYSWVEKSKEKCDELYTDLEFEEKQKKHSEVYSKDDLYFRELFNKMFDSRTELVPHKWIPNPEWGLGVTESSFRYLPTEQNA